MLALSQSALCHLPAKELCMSEADVKDRGRLAFNWCFKFRKTAHSMRKYNTFLLCSRVMKGCMGPQVVMLPMLLTSLKVVDKYEPCSQQFQRHKLPMKCCHGEFAAWVKGFGEAAVMRVWRFRILSHWEEWHSPKSLRNLHVFDYSVAGDAWVIAKGLQLFLCP